MSDITMCNNKACPARERCARAMRAPSVRQSWSKFPFWDDGQDHGTVCDYKQPWPRLNPPKVETALDRLLVMFEQKEDSDDACEDWCACDHICWRGGWCVFGSDGDYEQLIDELKTAIEEQG